MLSRKARHFSELTQDPTFPYRVGQLVGAAEMAAHFMEIQDDAQTQELGRRLHAVAGWFFTGEVDNGKPTDHPKQ